MVPGVPCVDHGDWDEKRDIARSSWQNAVFCEESFGENRALYVHLAYKDVDRFWKGWVYELHCLKASQVSKGQVRNVLVR